MQATGGPEAVSARLHAAGANAVPIGPGAFFGLRFGTGAEESPDPAIVSVPLHALGSGSPWEIWAGPEAVERDSSGGIGMVATANHVVVHARRQIGPGDDTSEVTRAIYLDLLGRIDELGYPHLVRIWNFVPDINRGEDDDETYVRFNRGRAAAFDQSGIPAARYPAATGVGSPAGSALTVIILGSRTEPLAIENPRQTSAYHYPRQYGPRSPAFARAMLLPERDGAKLFISGTASIVGHESRHRGIEQQLGETLANIEQLLQDAAATMPGLAAGGRRSWRVYLRDPADLARVEDEVTRRLGGRDTVVFLQAEICRRELLVEIEGVCELTAAGAAAGT